MKMAVGYLAWVGDSSEQFTDGSGHTGQEGGKGCPYVQSCVVLPPPSVSPSHSLS